MDFRELGERINALDFDHPFTIVDGEVSDAPGDIYAPDVYHDDVDDVDIQGDGWSALTGMTGQYSYHGAVMHPSEFIGGGIARALVEDFDAGTVFVVVVVGDLDDDEPVGWAILYR